ncbi:MAG: fumarylacetoacetate hydrolase family protein [Alphaproteobacteria bacterium]|nr:fumarylacetoacetate hydrolase family protein [Alphaproteobacteria bacterium]
MSGIIPSTGTFVGRVRAPNAAHPLVVTVRGDEIVDITSAAAPTVRDICEMGDPAAFVRAADGRGVCTLAEIEAGSRSRDPAKPYLLAPPDLQAVKAAGVTFVQSLLERVIEEQARGNPARAVQLRNDITGLIGADLSEIVPGSDGAKQVKAALIEKGVWSQYLEVGIGPDPEVFTKAQPMSAVGFGADVGLHPASKWNNPEPEIVLAVASSGKIVGAMLGNDVNLRDIEGRSALLLGKAKDNNASASLGPLIRLFDDRFSLDDVRTAEVGLIVEGEDGFVMEGASSMGEISRDPADLVAATLGPHHQYPDGLVLYLGTMFAPVKDRDIAGEGFTHKIGDLVGIRTPLLGRLENRVRLATECDPWTYGTRQLMGDLARAGLI